MTEPIDPYDDEPEEDLPRERGWLEQRPRRAPYVPAAIFYILCFIVSRLSWEHGLWVSRASIADRDEYWRLLTALFAHSDLDHLLSNGPLVVVFGTILFGYFGKLAFPVMPLIAGVLTHFFTVLTMPEHTRLVGASGMAYAMVGMWLVLYMHYEIRFSFKMRLLRAVGVGLVLLMPTTYSPTTSYMAHFIGFILGLVSAAGYILQSPIPRHLPLKTGFCTEYLLNTCT